MIRSIALAAAFAILAYPFSAAADSQPGASQRASAPTKNPQIDYGGFLELCLEVQPYREERRVDEAAFLALAKKSGTIILDTRSKWAYDDLHIKDAVHLNFSDFTTKSLEEALGDKSTRVWIYCNNNFKPTTRSLATKMAPTALNIPTFVALYGYGY
ncbi:Rhodanese-like domain protein [Posidoniimonas polymericola]|uniref:Rhodanese-like domain protein n=1 Tax=Posidoniimonas polymericola TaxID=2528002 RepID=A0A5C5YFZ7_9BACT|nr:rhodanese-like domain-containing protein [Posidoniimonas polymericola]TWT73773.1 Rhodanese-like domain protein [Posidoniimonas polymericola]